MLNTRIATFAGGDYILVGDTFNPRGSSVFMIEFAHQCLLSLDAQPGASGGHGTNPPREKRILIDMCCGSGVLGIALFHRAQLFDGMLGLDCSDDAVASCQMNMRQHNVPGIARRWRAGEPIGPQAADTFVICNPPYLPLDCVELTSPEREALCAADQGTRVAIRCLQSAATVDAPVVLKSLQEQVAQIGAASVRRVCVVHALSNDRTDGVVGSFWR